MNGYIEENNENKYLTLVPTNEAKDMLKYMKDSGAKSEILLNL